MNDVALESATEVSKWPKARKLAGFLFMLTPDNAAQILKGLEEPELEAVTAEMTRLTALTEEMQAEILQEFSGVAVTAVSSIPCGVERVQNLLEKSVGLLRASEIVCRVAPSGPKVAAMQQIVDMDAHNIFTLLRHEQLQTMALVISYLSPEKGSQVISMLRPEVREQVVERLATLSPTSIKVVENVAEELHRKVGGNKTAALSQTGGVKVAAQVLNALPKNVSESILMSIRERNAELGDAVRKKMFTFEELERLDVKTLQSILQTVDLHTLTVALKTAPESLKERLLSCISKRAAQTVREEIEFMGPLKLKEIEAAQSEVIDIVKRLEAEGEIDLNEMRQAARF